ncbi:Di-copper centre-containing protein [Thozetella sp. PMI_491]|nr:Di-copper centre-containing protein [Thozetella sp. PMI_491]
MSNLESWLQKNPSSSNCTLENAIVRREFTDLSVRERQDYISAAKCLQSTPAKSPRSLVPGARTRYDDFVATHINQTDWIHNTANFLSWHRYYLWIYEKAMREECGYTGAHPYWNWDRYASDPANSPLFNGNASSMSSGSSHMDACVDSGPFADMVVNLGPGKSLQSNPRCLVRNLSASQASQCTADKTLRLIMGSSDIASFQNTMQAVPGVHAGGHFTIGGNPGGDIYSSPGDPAFFLHHAMIDRVWWLWQMQNIDARLGAIAGSNARTGGLGKLTDTVDLGINADPTTLSTLMNTMGGLHGEMCYIYA